jgi:hypothetical protein
MAILRADIERALDELISNEEGMRFQALAVVLAKQKCPELIASERRNDGGLDAYPSVGFRFQHQQFQEYYAARFVANYAKSSGWHADLSTATNSTPESIGAAMNARFRHSLASLAITIGGCSKIIMAE